MEIIQTVPGTAARRPLFQPRWILWVAVMGLVVTACGRQDPLPAPPSGMGGAPGAALTAQPEALPNMSSTLSDLYLGWKAGEWTVDHLPTSPGFEFSQDRVRVTLIMQNEEAAQQALAALPAMEGEVLVSFQTWIDAWVPVAALEQVSRMPGVSLVREPEEVQPKNTP